MILHGTDTLAYSSSALSFMLENLGKPVIVTGSQIPAFETRSDGRDNLVGALIIAGNFSIPEVTVYFNHKLLRGNRTVKVKLALPSPAQSQFLTSGQCWLSSRLRESQLQPSGVCGHHDTPGQQVSLETRHHISPHCSVKALQGCRLVEAVSLHPN